MRKLTEIEELGIQYFYRYLELFNKVKDDLVKRQAAYLALGELSTLSKMNIGIGLVLYYENQEKIKEMKNVTGAQK